MKAFIVLLFMVFTNQADADCSNGLPLEGTLAIESCKYDGTPDCQPASEAFYHYSQAIKDNPKIISVGIQASPWHFYDRDMRIMEIGEVATLIRAIRKPEAESVWLIASWSDVAPDAGSKSLARRLSDALDGFPVKGMDGFLWLSESGKTRTTRQAVTVWSGAPVYTVKRGGEVMASLTAGWLIAHQDYFVSEGDAEGLMRAGAGWEIFMLCPDHALATFEAAAKLGNPIAAYNAAIMHTERGEAGDEEAAKALLAQAAAAGDKKAKARLGMPKD